MTILRENYITDGVDRLSINEDGSITTTSSGSVFQLEDSEGNKITSTALGSNKRSLDITVLGEDGYPIQVGQDGRLHVTTATPIDTSNATRISETYSAAVAGHAYELFTFLIPDGKILMWTKIIIGGQEGSSHAVIYEAPNGTLDGNETVVVDYYVNGHTVQYDIDKESIGDGLNTIIVKLQRLDKGKRLITLIGEGFLRDGT